MKTVVKVLLWKSIEAHDLLSGCMESHWFQKLVTCRRLNMCFAGLGPNLVSFFWVVYKTFCCWGGEKKRKKTVIKLCCVLSQDRKEPALVQNIAGYFCKHSVIFLAVRTAGPHASSLAEPNTVLALTCLHRLPDKWHLPFQEELW